MNIAKNCLSRWMPPSVLVAVVYSIFGGNAVAYAAGVRFVLNTAGDEVLDTQNGLVWRRCAQGQIWTETTCAGAATAMSWGSALSHAQTQASSTGLAWRVPNVKELASLLKLSTTAPAIDVAVFPGTSADWFWTSTPLAGDAKSAWLVDFGDGYASAASRYYQYPVRLVRTAP